MTTRNATSPRLRYDRTVGIVAMEGRGFSNPVDLAVSSESRIYVLSRTNTLQAYAIRIGICDLDSGYFGHFGSSATATARSCGRPPWHLTPATVSI